MCGYNFRCYSLQITALQLSFPFSRGAPLRRPKTRSIWSSNSPKLMLADGRAVGSVVARTRYTNGVFAGTPARTAITMVFHAKKCAVRVRAATLIGFVDINQIWGADSIRTYPSIVGAIQWFVSMKPQHISVCSSKKIWP